MEVNYRYNSKNEEKKKEVIEYFLSKEYGVSVMYEEISKIVGININVSAFTNAEQVEENLKYLKQFVGSLKNILITRGVVIKSIKGCGWYILKPSQISSYTYRNFIVKPQKSYMKATEILEHFDKTKLSEERKEEYQNVNQLNNALIQLTDKTIFTSAYYKNKNYYDNLEEGEK